MLLSGDPATHLKRNAFVGCGVGRAGYLPSRQRRRRAAYIPNLRTHRLLHGTKSCDCLPHLEPELYTRMCTYAALNCNAHHVSDSCRISTQRLETRTRVCRVAGIAVLARVALLSPDLVHTVW